MSEAAWIPHGEPKCFVDREWTSFDRIRIHLATRTGDGSLHVLHDDGTIRVYREGELITEGPGRPYLQLPEGLARVLLDALAAHFGGVSEVRSLRKDYDAERGRVDRLIGMIGKEPS